MDRVVGYMVSPLWKRSPVVCRWRSRSVCRGPSIVEREREIKAFVPEEFWEIDANTTTPFGDKRYRYRPHQNDKPFRPKIAADACRRQLVGARYSAILSVKTNRPAANPASAVYHLHAG